VNDIGIIHKFLRGVNRRLPEELRHNLLVRRRASLFRQAGVVFIHIPKAAGSSVNQALYGQFMGHYTVQNFIRSASSDVKALPRFAITRNPWSRTLSAYRFARAGRGFGGAVTAGIKNAEQYDIPEFKSFERFIIEWLDHQDIDQLDGIFRSQVSYITKKRKKLAVDHLGRMEDLQPTANWLFETLHREIKFPHGNRSGKQLDFRGFYSPQTAAIIARIYSEDIEAFGYNF